MSDRFVVTELEGWEIGDRQLSTSRPPGISCHVIDTLWNYRLIATYRSEDLVGPMRSFTREGRRSYVRQQARDHADRLNQAAERAAA